MTDNVKKELELHVRELQHSIDNIVPYADTTEDVVKMNFESIRLLVDYCEGLSLEGEPAMTRWRREKFKEKIDQNVQHMMGRRQWEWHFTNISDIWCDGDWNLK